MHKALTIAGSDNSGGAGIQADLKVFSFFGVYGMTAVTSITVQNSLGVKKSVPIPADLLFEQIEAIATDINIDAFKTGMLQTEENVLAVYEAVKKFRLKNFVCDPVIRSKNGKYLLDKGAVETFIKKIIPLTLIVTPNTEEAEVITGMSIQNVDHMKKAAIKIKKIGAQIVVIKGGHLPSGGTVTDLVYYKDEFLSLSYPKVETKHTHGTGCTFSAGITALIAKGTEKIKAIKTARAYTQGAIENAVKTGKGTGSLNHFWNM